MYINAWFEILFHLSKMKWVKAWSRKVLYTLLEWMRANGFGWLW
jgi:hypothetical protein